MITNKCPKIGIKIHEMPHTLSKQVQPPSPLQKQRTLHPQQQPQPPLQKQRTLHPQQQPQSPLQKQKTLHPQQQPPSPLQKQRTLQPQQQPQSPLQKQRTLQPQQQPQPPLQKQRTLQPQSPLQKQRTLHNPSQTMGLGTGTYNQIDQEATNKQHIVLHQQPIATTNFFNNLDLNLANYEYIDLLNLFDIPKSQLTEEIMKSAKRKVLKLHPDKCKTYLDPKIYEFFQRAYKYLEEIRDFQNISNKDNRNTSYSSNDICDEENRELYKNYFEQNEGGFSVKRFNEQFDKYYVKDEYTNKGYDDWFKSDEGILEQPKGKISKNEMDRIIQLKKNELCKLVPYTGVAEHIYTGSNAGGILLDTSQIENFTGSTSGDIFSNRGLAFTDLKQAYTETLLPIGTDEDFNNIKKYSDVKAYTAEREMSEKTYKIMTKQEADNYLLEQENKNGLKASSIAFKLAKQSDKLKESNNHFWNNIRQIAYGDKDSTHNGMLLLQT